ncbi:DUF2314 domain-containing protein [Tabrizicola sp.]|uniref:DUF2314 domain-containing protein n=1 Tax=Tabrizicola sp. TaxID=2005166 RepID=UPI003F35E631
MMLRVLALAVGLSGPAVAQNEIIPYAEDDPAMESAISEARDTLPLFLEHAFDSEGQSVEAAAIKVEIPTVAGSPMDTEHIWVTPFARFPDGSFVGLLANAPVHLGELQQWDQVDFSIDMISDWHFTAPSGRYWGNYTSRVMYEAGAFGDTPFDQIFEPEPVPADWR